MGAVSLWQTGSLASCYGPQVNVSLTDHFGENTNLTEFGILSIEYQLVVTSMYVRCLCKMMGLVYAGWKSDRSYGGNAITSGLYKLSVAIWILLGLASCASFITTLQETYSAIMLRLEDKAIELKEMAGISDDRPGSSDRQSSSSLGGVTRSKRRVAPIDSDADKSESCNN